MEAAHGFKDPLSMSSWPVYGQTSPPFWFHHHQNINCSLFIKPFLSKISSFYYSRKTLSREFFGTTAPRFIYLSSPARSGSSHKGTSRIIIRQWYLVGTGGTSPSIFLTSFEPARLRGILGCLSKRIHSRPMLIRSPPLRLDPGKARSLGPGRRRLARPIDFLPGPMEWLRTT